MIRRTQPNAVFISYRRADSGEWAARLEKHIGFRFGHDLVFRDITDIPLGKEFMQVLDRELSRSRVFLVVIGPEWVENDKGERRLEDRKDVLRAEVTRALESVGTVIPIIVGGAPLPEKADIPAPLRRLLDRQATTLRPEHWSGDVKALLDQLRDLVLPTRVRLSLAEAQSEARRMQDHYFALLGRDPAQALETTRTTQTYLDQVLPIYPQDPELKVTRGYIFKNEAMALRDLERDGEAWEALKRGDGAFRTMLKERRRDASAWNGLGSIAAVRAGLLQAKGDLGAARKEARAALNCIDKALEIEPNYSFAQTDRLGVQRLLADLG
jgi:hypothetical protein